MGGSHKPPNFLQVVPQATWAIVDTNCIKVRQLALNADFSPINPLTIQVWYLKSQVNDICRQFNVMNGRLKAKIEDLDTLLSLKFSEGTLLDNFIGLIIQAVQDINTLKQEIQLRVFVRVAYLLQRIGAWQNEVLNSLRRWEDMRSVSKALYLRGENMVVMNFGNQFVIGWNLCFELRFKLKASVISVWSEMEGWINGRFEDMNDKWMRQGKIMLTGVRRMVE